MPKKRRQTYQPKPGSNYVHPSLSGSPRSTDHVKGPGTLSVNERLSNLRLAQASPASAERKREFAELSNQRSLPPSLGQGILGLRASAAPIPRNNNAPRSRIRLRTPGPAPPRSWLSGPAAHRQALESRYHLARRTVRTFGTKTGQVRTCPQQLAQFLNMTGDNPILSGSLLDMALRSAALNWTSVVEDCFDFLDVIPTHLRVVLLSYLTRLGPPEGIDMNGLQVLFPSLSDVACLDLSSLVGWGFTLKEFRKWIHRAAEVPTGSIHNQGSEEGGILDSWDQEALSDEDNLHRILDLTISPIFDSELEHLSRLSLANPPPSISWVDMLSLSKDLHTITHLSLAGWPLPTRTPNMTSPYAALDRDFQESALVLRMLAENTYCLRWLDLQGCHEWLGALIWRPSPIDAEGSSSSSNSDWSPGRRGPKGPDWNGSWRHVTYLNVAQDGSGWQPRNRALMKSQSFRQRMAQKYFRLGLVHQQIIDDLRDYLDKKPAQREYQVQHCTDCHDGDVGDCDQTCGACTRYQDTAVGMMARWLEREVEARNVARGVIAARAGTTNPRCTFDHGWQNKSSYPVLAQP